MSGSKLFNLPVRVRKKKEKKLMGVSPASACPVLPAQCRHVMLTIFLAWSSAFMTGFFMSNNIFFLPVKGYQKATKGTKGE